MEFFEYLRIPQVVMQYFSSGGITIGQLYILLGVAGGAYLVSLVVGGLALYNMAERAGMKHAWLGFLPFLHTYYAGKVAGETRFFGHKMKRVGLYAMLAEFFYVAIEVLSLVSSILLSSPAYYETNFVDGIGSLIFNPDAVPAALVGLQKASVFFSIFSVVANLVMLFFFCILYNALYRKYCPKNPFVMTVFSVIFPVRTFLTFAVRDNEPVDYEEYMQRRLEQMMQSVNTTLNEAEKTAGEPFSDFAPQNPNRGNPFAEFDDDPPPSASNENGANGANSGDNPPNSQGGDSE